MKQQSIAVIVIIAFFSGIIAFFVSGKIFVTPANRQQTVPIVDAISTQFQLPSTKYFNSQSVNPTQEIQIGGSANSNPFTAASNQ